MAAPLYIGCYSVWDNVANDDANERWHHETLKSLEPITRGHYWEKLICSHRRPARQNRLRRASGNGSRRFDSGMIPTRRSTATLARREARIQSIWPKRSDFSRQPFPSLQRFAEKRRDGYAQKPSSLLLFRGHGAHTRCSPHKSPNRRQPDRSTGVQGAANTPA